MMNNPKSDKKRCETSFDDQMICALREYIQIDTTHPAPNYSAAIIFLKKQAGRDGFLFQEVPLPSGNTVAIITFPGTDKSLPAIALNHHMDVVPATNANEWTTPPFAGAIHNGQLIGRGVQDMKGVGITHYFAMKQLKEQGITPKRTIHILAVPDEENGGFKGTKEFVQTEAFKNLNLGYLLDEGSSSGNDQMLYIKVSERKALQVRVMGKGQLAHGSRLSCFNVTHEMVRFLKRITELHKEQQEKIGGYQPGQLLSLNITSLTAGIRKTDGHPVLNMVPNTAESTIDIRLPPTMKKKDILRLFEEELSKFKHLTYSIEEQMEEEMELPEGKTELYLALADTIKKFHFDVQPLFFEASSDLRFHLARNIDGLGFTPFTVADNIHGTDEAVPVDQIIKGKNIIYQFLKDFCAPPG